MSFFNNIGTKQPCWSVNPFILPSLQCLHFSYLGCSCLTAKGWNSFSAVKARFNLFQGRHKQLGQSALRQEGSLAVQLMLCVAGHISTVSFTVIFSCHWLGLIHHEMLQWINGAQSSQSNFPSFYVHRAIPHAVSRLSVSHELLRFGITTRSGPS